MMVVAAEREDALAPDLDKYRGQWVAIKNGQIVASAKDAGDVIAELRKADITGAALHRVSENPDNALVL